MVKKEDIEGINDQIKELQKKYDELTIEVKILKNEKSSLNNKSKKNKDSNKPKKNSNAYIHFCNEYRKEHPDEKNVLKVASKEWKTIKENKELRNKYDLMAEDDKKRYDIELDIFISKNNE